MHILAILLAFLTVGTANAATWERPSGGYTPTLHAVNTTKYQVDSANRVTIGSAKLDGDMNKAFDGLNAIDARTPPSVTGNTGKFLSNNGTSATWAAITSSSVSSISATSGQALTADGSGGANWAFLIPVGTIMPYAGTSATVPARWAMLYGQSVSRTGIYADLFAVVGTTYGSADSNSFNLPDMRGRVVAGVDNMGGTIAGRISLTTAGISGTILGSAGGDQASQAHNHTLTDPGHVHGQTSNGQPAVNLSATGPSVSGNAWNLNGASSPQNMTSTATTGITLASYGAGNSQNVQPTIMLNYIIRY